jgi:hypothetical protein
VLVRKQVRNDVEPQCALPHPIDGGDVDADLEPGVAGCLAERCELVDGDDDDILPVGQVPCDVLECVEQALDDLALGALARFGLCDDLGHLRLTFPAWSLGAHRLISPAVILSCRVRIPCMRL